MVEVGQIRRFRVISDGKQAGRAPRFVGRCLVVGKRSHPWVDGSPRDIFCFLMEDGKAHWLWDTQMEAKTVLIDEEVADADADR